MSGAPPLFYGFDINELYDFDLAARDGVRQSSRAAQPVAGTADPTTAGAGADARGFAVSTGDDTAAFFARHGSLGPKKFEYLGEKSQQTFARKKKVQLSLLGGARVSAVERATPARDPA